MVVTVISNYNLRTRARLTSASPTPIFRQAEHLDRAASDTELYTRSPRGDRSYSDVVAGEPAEKRKIRDFDVLRDESPVAPVQVAGGESALFTESSEDDVGRPWTVVTKRKKRGVVLDTPAGIESSVQKLPGNTGLTSEQETMVAAAKSRLTAEEEYKIRKRYENTSKDANGTSSPESLSL